MRVVKGGDQNMIVVSYMKESAGEFLGGWESIDLFRSFQYVTHESSPTPYSFLDDSDISSSQQIVTPDPLSLEREKGK